MPEFIGGQPGSGLAGVDTSDGYTTALTLGPAQDVAQITFNVVGNPAFVQFWKPVPGQPSKATLEPFERFYYANSYGVTATGVSGVRFRSYNAGEPATITAEMDFVTDPVVFPGTVAGVNLTPSGGIVPPSQLETTDGVTDVVPTNELLIGSGLVLSEPATGVAQIDAGIAVGPWYYATPVSPATAPSGGIASSAFQNSVANAAQPDGSYDPLRWRQVGETVEFAGTITSTPPGTVILTLPVAFWPVNDTEAAIVSADGSSSFSVGVSASNGNVTLLAVTGTGSGSTPGGPASGDLSGSYPGPTVSAINGSPLGTTAGASNGQGLLWNGSAWVPTTIVPSGAAGGDLSGTYPNPGVAKINGSPLGTTTGASSGQGLLWNGSAWVAASVTDADLSLSDITTNNVSTAAHGFAPKLPNSATLYLDGTGNYTTPPGTQTGVITKIYSQTPTDGVTRNSGTIGSFSTAWQIASVVVGSGQNVMLRAQIMHFCSVAVADYILAIYRGSTEIASILISNPTQQYKSVPIEAVDVNPGAGTYTYEIKCACFVFSGNTTTITVRNVNITTDTGGGTSSFIAEVYNP